VLELAVEADAAGVVGESIRLDVPVRPAPAAGP
jgi:hypothetical protein